MGTISYAQNIRLGFYDQSDGLSQMTVQHIVQDNKGFLWFATQEGLNRFDGYKFKVFRSDINDSASISSSIIEKLLIDSSGTMWVATRNGLNRYHPDTETFTRYMHDSADESSLSHPWVMALYEDKQGILWVGTLGGGLNRFNHEDGTFKRYQADSTTKSSLSDNFIYAIHEDNQGVFWVATRNGGLNVFNRIDESFIQFRHNPNDATSLSHDRVYSIVEDRDGQLWFGTRGGGLNRFIRKSQRFERFLHDPANPFSLGSDFINGMVSDKQGNLWLTTFHAGLCQLNKQNMIFHCYKNNEGDPFSLSANTAVSVYLDNSDTLWIGTFGGGINFYNPAVNRFKHYYHVSNQESSLSENSIWSVYKDNQNQIWVGTENNGVDIIDVNKEKVLNIKHDPNKKLSISSNHIRSIFQDHRGDYWLGTEENGLNRLDKDKQFIARYQYEENNQNSLSSNDQILAIAEDQRRYLWVGTRHGLNRFSPDRQSIQRYLVSDGRANSIRNDVITGLLVDSRGLIWVATNQGLYYFNYDENGFTSYLNDPNDRFSINDKSILAIAEDDHGDIWLGYSQLGLSKLDWQTQKFSHFNHATEKLPSESIYGIESDHNNHIWFSTNRGIGRLNVITEEYHLFSQSDGLQGNEFNQGASYRSPDNTLLFGGINGVSVFNPQDITINEVAPSPIITDFHLFNQPIKIEAANSAAVLNKSITETDKLSLSYRESIFSFDFSALNYTTPEQVSYEYMLDGFHQAWIQTDAENRRATFTNIPHGVYQFRVRAFNKFGVGGDQEAKLQIVITPPWWKTWWAKIIMLALSISLAYTWYYQRMRNYAIQEKRLKTKVEQRTAEVVKQKEALEQSYRNITVISDIGKEITSSLSLEQVLLMVYEHVNSLMSASIFGIGIYDGEKEEIRYELAIKGGYHYRPYTRPMSQKNQFPVWCIENQKEILINDIDKEGESYIAQHEYSQQHFKEYHVEREGIDSQAPKSFIYVPMFTKTGVLGVMTVQSNQLGSYTHVHVDMLKTLATYTANAIENARAHQKLQDAQSQLVESAKIASLGRLVSGVAHELNTPLGVAITSASVLESESKNIFDKIKVQKLTKQEFRGFESTSINSLRLLNQNLKRASNLVNNFKKIAVDKSEETKSSFDVQQLVETLLLSINPLLKNKDIKVILEIPTELIVTSYANTLTQVFINLIMNSIDHGLESSSGTITIKVNLDEKKQLTIDYSDNGAGMDKETLKKLFDPFFTTKGRAKHLGLGMIVVYNYVTHILHGTIDVTSALNQGFSAKICFAVDN